jgi:hypothetical protein
MPVRRRCTGRGSAGASSARPRWACTTSSATSRRHPRPAARRDPHRRAAARPGRSTLPGRPGASAALARALAADDAARALWELAGALVPPALPARAGDGRGRHRAGRSSLLSRARTPTRGRSTPTTCRHCCGCRWAGLLPRTRRR